MVLNGPEAMDALENSVELIGPKGDVLESLQGTKEYVARGIMKLIGRTLVG